MASVAELQADLVGVQAAIASLQGDGDAQQIPTQEFWEQGDRWRGLEISRLYQERRRLRAEISQSGSGTMRRIKIIDP